MLYATATGDFSPSKKGGKPGQMDGPFPPLQRRRQTTLRVNKARGGEKRRREEGALQQGPIKASSFFSKALCKRIAAVEEEEEEEEEEARRGIFLNIRQRRGGNARKMRSVFNSARKGRETTLI